MQLPLFDRKADRLSRDVRGKPVPQVNPVFKNFASTYDAPLDVQEVTSRKRAVNARPLVNSSFLHKVRLGSRHPVLISVGIVQHLDTRTIHTDIVLA
jgi:hypothetical protein